MRPVVERGSCLLKAIPTTLHDKSRLIVWSDSCSGQNKNFKMMCVWLYMVKSGMLDEDVCAAVHGRERHIR